MSAPDPNPSLPRKTLQDILSVLWVIQLRCESRESEQDYTIELPREMVALTGDLVNELERLVCGPADPDYCPASIHSGTLKRGH